MRILFLLFVLALAFLPATADEYTDTATKVVYSYERGSDVAQVKAGKDAKGEITILERFTINGQEYVVNRVDDSAFKENKWITAVFLPQTIQDIQSHAFQNCTSLKSVPLPEGLLRIGLEAFRGSAITSLELPGSLWEVAWAAFMHCDSLKSLRLSSTSNGIRPDSFRFCDALETIVVDERNEGLDSRNGCNAIIVTATDELIMGCKGTVIPPSVKCIGEEAFGACQTLKEITIPESVDTIGTMAFYNCRNLSYVSLPKSLRIIGPLAFTYTNLQTVTIPPDVTQIWLKAFAEIPTLTSITSLIENPFDLEYPICDETGYDTVTLYVPAGTKEKYMAAEGWKDFAHIVEIDKSSVNDAIVETDAARSPVYDLQGRRLSGEPTKGIYIKDGRKYAK